MDEADRRTLLLALDETPSTVTGLSRRLDWEEGRVEDGLAELEADKLAIDWGDLWATTWRAKLEIEPRFFRIWIPASTGLGAGVLALALILNGPEGLAAWVAPLFALVAVLGLTIGLVPALEDR